MWMSQFLPSLWSALATERRPIRQYRPNTVCTGTVPGKSTLPHPQLQLPSQLPRGLRHELHPSWFNSGLPAERTGFEPARGAIPIRAAFQYSTNCTMYCRCTLCRGAQSSARVLVPIQRTAQRETNTGNTRYISSIEKIPVYHTKRSHQTPILPTFPLTSSVLIHQKS